MSTSTGLASPQSLHEVRSFVGLCLYYRRHIQGFTELAAPLYKLETKGTDFEWTERRNEAFWQLKNALTSAPILGFPREEGLWYLDTDASNVGTGAVLSQIQDGEERVIAYISKSLEGREQRYCTARKELLAVVRALKHFKCYLYRQKITVRTDNRAVSWLHRSKDPVGQPARWIEVIDTFWGLEGQGWRPQLVTPADRPGIMLQHFHGGAIGAHLGTARTLALAEQGFYWPGM